MFNRKKKKAKRLDFLLNKAQVEKVSAEAKEALRNMSPEEVRAAIKGHVQAVYIKCSVDAEREREFQNVINDAAKNYVAIGDNVIGGAMMRTLFFPYQDLIPEAKGFIYGIPYKHNTLDLYLRIEQVDQREGRTVHVDAETSTLTATVPVIVSYLKKDIDGNLYVTDEAIITIDKDSAFFTDWTLDATRDTLFSHMQTWITTLGKTCHKATDSFSIVFADPRPVNFFNRGTDSEEQGCSQHALFLIKNAKEDVIYRCIGKDILEMALIIDASHDVLEKEFTLDFLNKTYT